MGQLKSDRRNITRNLPTRRRLPFLDYPISCRRAPTQAEVTMRPTYQPARSLLVYAGLRKPENFEPVISLRFALFGRCQMQRYMAE